MKTIFFRSMIHLLLLVTCTALTEGRPVDSELALVITIVTGERGKDSHSTTTILTLSGDKLTYQQTYRGAHSGNRTPVKNEYKLTSADRDELIKLMREKNLLITRTLTTLSQEDAPGSYFSLLIRSRLDGEEHSISIKLPATATKLKGDHLYQDSVSLVGQLYRVIKRTDPDTAVPQLIQ